MSCVSQVNRLLRDNDNWVEVVGRGMWKYRSGTYEISAWFDHVNFYYAGGAKSISPDGIDYENTLKMYIDDPHKCIMYLHNKELNEAIERLD